MRDIALWNTAFLGDAVLSLSLVHTLKQAWPQAKLDMYVRSGLGPLFAAQNSLRAVYEVPKKMSFVQTLRLGKQIAARAYGTWVSPHQSHRSSLIACLSGAAVRVGYSGAWHRKLAYTLSANRCFDSLDEIDRLHQLAKILNVPGQPQHAAWPELSLPAEAAAKAADFWRLLAAKPCLGLHPGSTWGTKRWTVQGFAHTAQNALSAGCQVLVFAGPGEEDTARQVLDQLPAHPDLHNLAGSLSLAELAAFITRLDCYLSNDSGPMHLAWVQHVPVVAVFGPTTRSLGFYPRSEKSRVIEVLNVPCRPCSLHGPQICPKGHHDCMRTIDAELVWQACKEFLVPGAG